jgi:hypothetical protein
MRPDQKKRVTTKAQSDSRKLKPALHCGFVPLWLILTFVRCRTFGYQLQSDLKENEGAPEISSSINSISNYQ